MRACAHEIERTQGWTIVLGVTFTLLMVLSAFIRIPLAFSPVPITLQTLVLYMSLVVLRKYASFSQIGYIALGAFGLPVFTNGGFGLLYLLGPTGGYLFGFLLVAFICPALLPRHASFGKMCSFFTLATGIIYVSGVAWLVFVHQFSPRTAVTVGVVPFLIGDAIKIGVSAFFASRILS